MTSSPGQYVYVSPGRDDVCGLFVVGTVNQVVAIEFTDFSVDCDDGGLVVVGVVDPYQLSTCEFVGSYSCSCNPHLVVVVVVN